MSRSIFDITCQNFGRLDECIAVANDNGASLNAEAPTNPVIEDYEGDVKKKDAIALRGLTFNNDFTEIEIVPEKGVKGVVVFDGIDDYISFASIPDITGTKNISFYLYLLKSSGYSFNVIANFTIMPVANDRLTVWLNGSNIEVNVNAAQSSAYSIAGMENNILFIEIDKFQDAGLSGQISDFRINGVSQIESVSGTTWGTQGATIGANSTPNAYLKDAYVWGFDFSAAFTADGKPAGNTNEAWSQSIPATVNGSPSIIDLP